MSSVSRRRTVVVILALVVVLAFVYVRFDPAGSVFFPKCAFKSLTGLECPGCGSQRAMHSLLNFDLPGAARANILLVLAIPYLITGFVFEMKKDPGPRMLRWRKILFGQKAALVIFTIIIIFSILRNII